MTSSVPAPRNPPTPSSLLEIEARAKNYRAARDLLADRLRQLNEQIDAAKRGAMPLIRSALLATKAAESELSGAILAAPQHFQKPRTHIFHGVRVGLEKSKGTIRIEDAARCVALIRKHLKDQFDLLVKTKYTPVKSAIAGLPAADLKRIGAEIKDAGDAAVIRPVDSELEKMLDALLKADEPKDESD